jgi:antitoxin component YwqK of YwqJK toxin-antitoxin module
MGTSGAEPNWEDFNMQRVAFRSLRHDEDGKMWHEGNLFTGIAVEYWPNGKVASEMSYLDGIEDGPSVGWHDNGVPRRETNYRRGRVAGIVRKWDRNGQLSMEEEVDGGVALWRKQWDERGNLVEDYRLHQ